MTDLVYKPICKIIAQSSEHVHLHLTIPENLFYLQGHFDSMPILPGVAQLDWVLSYLQAYLDVDTKKVVSVDALKFQMIVQPNYEIELRLKKIKPNKFSFSYDSEHGKHASGKVVLMDQQE